MDVCRLCVSVALQFYDILEAASCLRGVTVEIQPYLDYLERKRLLEAAAHSLFEILQGLHLVSPVAGSFIPAE